MITKASADWLAGLRRRGEFVPRLVAFVAWAAGVVTVISALLPAERSRLRVIEDWLGSTTVTVAAGSAAAAGVALILLAGGLRRRQRNAWRAAVVLAAGSTVLHLAKGLDVEEASLSLALLLVLIAARDQFRAAGRTPGWRVRIAVLAAVGVTNVAAGLVLVDAYGLADSPGTGPRLRHVLLGLAGISGPAHFAGDETATTVSAVLAGLGAITLLTAIWVVMARPQRHPARTPDQDAALAALLARDDGDSLGWFATRDDRDVVLSPTGKAAVSYQVVGGVALAAGDPLGDPEAWPKAIEAFLAEAARHAWVPAVIGCGHRAGEVWQRAGLDALELGDEAIVEVGSFSLEGRAMRGIRQSAGRVARAGYTTRIRRAGEVSAEEWEQIRSAAHTWRVGGVERGFSMALGRLGDLRDAGGMLACSYDADGRLRALLHFVPWGTDGLSLDLMRRDPTSDNGVNEALIVALIQAVPAFGIRRLSLNFAVFRSAIERGGQLGAGPVARLWRRLLLIGSRWWQIEQMYRFNAKFGPEWRPRYLCYPGSRELARVAVAALRAEAFLVLPGSGRGRAPRPLLAPAVVSHEPAH
ncbi:MAG TPA: phosphatidylglycerol lysyltransferase domain-containing protein [Sporichthya sp.]|nr:phosphatidylglycerol lysyltransferase domain-containing protein [Sporichthya sp.]